MALLVFDFFYFLSWTAFCSRQDCVHIVYTCSSTKILRNFPDTFVTFKKQTSSSRVSFKCSSAEHYANPKFSNKKVLKEKKSN